MRKFFIAIAFLLSVIYIFSRMAEIQNIVLTLEQGVWFYLVPAMVLQVFWLLNTGLSYKILYRILELPGVYHRLVRMSAAATFLNVVAPVGGMSGLAVFMDDAKKRNYSSARVLVAGALFVLFDYFGFLAVLFTGMFILFRRNDLTWPVISASILLAIGAIGLAGVLYLGMRSGKLLGKIFSWGTQRINRLLYFFLHRDYIQPDQAMQFAAEIEEGLQTLRSKPLESAWLLLLAILGKALLIGVLSMMFLAFHVALTPGTLIAGFSIGYLFLIVAPTPSGIGFVEGALTLALNSFYVPLADATVIVVAYRGITLWLPLVIGMVAFRSLNRWGKVKSIAI
jgi:uncharacterized protein (TIRG00374 family)